MTLLRKPIICLLPCSAQRQVCSMHNEDFFSPPFLKNLFTPSTRIKSTHNPPSPSHRPHQRRTTGPHPQPRQPHPSPAPTCSAGLTLGTPPRALHHHHHHGDPPAAGAPLPIPPHAGLTHSSTLRKASGSFTTRKVPAEASCGQRQGVSTALRSSPSPPPALHRTPRSSADLVHRLHGAAAPRSRAEPPASRGCAARRCPRARRAEQPGGAPRPPHRPAEPPRAPRTAPTCARGLMRAALAPHSPTHLLLLSSHYY